MNIEAAKVLSMKPDIVAYKPRPFGDVFLTLWAPSFNDVDYTDDGSDGFIGVFEEGYILLSGEIPMHTHTDCGLTDMPNISKAFTEVYTLDEHSLNQEVGICVYPSDEWIKLTKNHSPEYVKRFVMDKIIIPMEPGQEYVCPVGYHHSIINFHSNQPRHELPRINTCKYLSW